MKPDLSILIPARQEMFLDRTIKDALRNMRGNTEIIAVCDGAWANPPVEDHAKVTVMYYPEAIGQRAATNEAAKLSKAKYLMKCDSHCAFDEGFDVKMIAEMQPSWTMVPIMRNLHAFDWVCKKCGDRRYQGPTPTSCPKCPNTTEFERDIKWIGKTNPQSTSYCFDYEPHFQYFTDFKRRPEGKGDLTETMSLQGSCFMVTRDRYFELDLCSEEFGSWGSQGIEVAVKSWLSGGRVICNHKTWYAHMFRTQGGDFSFPWPCSGRQVRGAKLHAKDLFFNNKWDKQIYPLSWLLDKFWPVPGWTEEQRKPITDAGKKFYDERGETKMVIKDTSTLEEEIMKPVIEVVKPAVEVMDEEPKRSVKGVWNKDKKDLTVGLVYYTHHKCDPYVLEACQKQMVKCMNGNDIVSVSLKPINFGRNVVLPLEPGYLTMFKEILAGVEASTADLLFFGEHDVLYHPSHFEFRPPRKDMFYYDENRWMIEYETGRALFYHAMSTSLLCASRELLLEHYRTRVARVEKEGFSYRLGFEPGNHPYPRGVDLYQREAWFASFPSLDIRHGKNLTASRWSKDEFRNKKNLHAWKEADVVPFWGLIKGRVKEVLGSV